MLFENFMKIFLLFEKSFDRLFSKGIIEETLKANEIIVLYNKKQT